MADDRQANDEQNYLHLGTFLDQLLNDECRLSDAGSIDPGRPGGIRIPRASESGEPDDPGTGNIVIMGGPGTGKTTLALHMGNACCARPDNRRFMAAYFSLEEPFYRLKTKAKAFGWDPVVQRLRSVESTRHPPTSRQLGEWLYRAVCRAQDKVNEEWKAAERDHGLEGFCPQPLLVPTLSPATMEPDRSSDSVFWKRFRQLESFLDAASHLRGMKLAESDGWYQELDLRLVFLDSLTVFGGRLLTRDELSRLFTLFSRTQTIGVFIVEDKAAFSPAPDEQHMETIDSLADVVIRLRNTQEHGYFRRNMEITKSRYNHNILGIHGIRIEGRDSSGERNWSSPREHVRDIVGFLPMPSIHYMLSAQESPAREKFGKPAGDPRLCLGDSPLNFLLPQNYHSDWAVLIAGARHCFKTALAVNYLLRGVFPPDSQPEQKPENVLLVRLHDRPLLSVDESFYGQTRLWHDFARRWDRGEAEYAGRIYESPTAIRTFWRGYRNGNRIGVRPVSGLEELAGASREKTGGIIELVLKTGAVSAEKALVSIWDLLHASERLGIPVRRVVLDDISRIGVSYPAIFQGEISQKLFVTALAHMLRKRRIGLVMVGTDGEAVEGDEMIARAKSVANTVITARFIDVYGERHVAVTGEGLASGAGDPANARMESVPITVRDPERGGDDGVAFTADAHQLDGLIGFSQPGDPIKRPGSTLYVFQEGKIQKRYFDQLELLLRASLGGDDSRTFCASTRDDGAGSGPFFSPDIGTFPGSGADRPEPQCLSVSAIPSHFSVFRTEKGIALGAGYRQDDRLKMVRFGSADSSAMFDAVDMQYKHGTPQDRTVLFMLDEFAGDYLRRRFAPLFPGEEPGKLESSQVFSRNLLLLASCNESKENELKESVVSWADLAEEASRGALICTDKLAHETYSCCLLDAVFSGMTPPEVFESCKDFVNYLGMAAKDKNVWDEVEAMGRVLAHAVDINDATCATPEHMICWYSQLRDWVQERQNRVLPMTLMPLPGKGFTGDWYIGVLKGSVSLRLGKEIVDLMCSRHEQYQRFLAGVGLPDVTVDHLSGNSTFLVLPVKASSGKQRLGDLLAIHRMANRRSSIPEYFRFRDLLYHAICRITECCPTRTRDENDLEAVKKNLVELPEQIREILTPEQLDRLWTADFERRVGRDR